MLYREAGTGGRAKSTIIGKETAMKHFKTYLLTRGIIYAESTEEILCSESSFRRDLTMVVKLRETQLNSTFLES
jgi:hypothetical protein